MQPLGPTLKSLRESMGITQRDLAESVGVDRTYVSSIEVGRVQMPNANLRRRFAASLGVKHIDLLLAAGEIRADELDCPPTSSNHDNRFHRMLDALDLSVSDRSDTLEILFSLWLSQDRAKGRIIELIADDLALRDGA